MYAIRNSDLDCNDTKLITRGLLKQLFTDHTITFNLLDQTKEDKRSESSWIRIVLELQKLQYKTSFERLQIWRAYKYVVVFICTY